MCESEGRSSRTVDHELAMPRRYPWDFECVVMYARYECRHLIGTGTEAELLVELLTSRAVLLQRSPDLLNGVQGLGSRIMVLLEKAILYFCC